MPFWRDLSVMSDAGFYVTEKSWTFAADELKPGDILLSKYGKLMVSLVRVWDNGPQARVAGISLETNQPTLDDYCYLWDHQVIRDGEIIYDANDEPEYKG